MHGRYRDGVPAEDRQRLIGCAFSGAIVASPFIALLYSRRIGLGVLALALICTLYFTFVARNEVAGRDTRTKLLVLMIVNALFLSVTVLALVLLAMG